MEFGLSADQRMMQDSVLRTLERVCPLERIKAAAAATESHASDVQAALRELGVPALLASAEHGGLGLSLLDAALAGEALGYHAAPVPFLGNALAVIALRESGNPALQAEYLPGLASGEIIAGAALSECIAGARDGAGVTAADGKLNGKALFVIDGMAADIVIVAGKTGTLHLARAAGVTRIALASIDATRRLAELQFDNTPAEPLNAPAGTLTRLRDAAWVLIAADTLGASQHMLDAAVAYAKERQQFGRVIGSFQAVKHLCAEMAAELEPCRALVWYAAHVFDARPEEASVAAAHAKAHLSETGTFIARTATEVHGGMGITDLLGVHYWFKRIGLNRQLLGGPERVRQLAAMAQGFV